MMYIIVDKAKAVEFGFKLHTHIEAHGKMILNEKELLDAPFVSGDTLQERAENIGGKVMTEAEVEQFKKNGGE